MSIDAYSNHGYFIKFDDKIIKILKLEEEINKIDNDLFHIYDYWVNKENKDNKTKYKDSILSIIKKVDELIGKYNYQFAYINDTADFHGSNIIEPLNLYIEVWEESLFERKPTELYNKLKEIGIEPVEDSFVTFF